MLDFRHIFRLAVPLPLLLSDNTVALCTLHRRQQLGVGGLLTKPVLRTGQLASLPLTGNVSHLLLVLKTTPAPTHVKEDGGTIQPRASSGRKQIEVRQRSRQRPFKASNKHENIQLKEQPKFSSRQQVGDLARDGQTTVITRD